MKPTPGGIYDAGRGGTPTFRYYRLVEDTDPSVEIVIGARVPDGGFVLDFGPVQVRVSELDWRARAAREAHVLKDGTEFTECGACGVLFLAGDWHECPTQPERMGRA